MTGSYSSADDGLPVHLIALAPKVRTHSTNQIVLLVRLMMMMVMVMAMMVMMMIMMMYDWFW